MAEPEGLKLSLDDLIKKRQHQNRPGSGSGRGRGGRFDGGRGRGSGRFGADSVRGGFVQKSTGRGYGHQNNQGGFRGGFSGERRGGYAGVQGGGRGGYGGVQKQFGQEAGFAQQRFQQSQTMPQQQGWVQRQRLAQNQFNIRPQGFVQQGFPQQQGFSQQQRQYAQVQQSQQYVQDDIYEDEEILEEEGAELEYPPPEVFLDEATGNVVARIQDVDIVTIYPDGVIQLWTGGFFTDDTLAGFNAVLSLLGISVEAKDNEGNWVVRDGARLLRFTDGMRLPHRGLMSQTRGQVVLAHFTGAGMGLSAAQLAQQASRASSAAAAALLGAGGLVGGLGMGRIGGAGNTATGLALVRGGLMGTGSGRGAVQPISDMQRRLMRQGRS